MDLLKNPGRGIYGLLSFTAFLCAFVVAITSLLGFAYAGAVGDAPGDPGYRRYTFVVALIFAGTAALFVGMLGTSIRSKVFPIVSIFGSGLLLLPLTPFALSAISGTGDHFKFLILLFIALLVALLCLSILKLKQISPRGTL